MMSIVLFRPFAISTKRSTDKPYVLDTCNTASSFTHKSNLCTNKTLAFLNLVLIDLSAFSALYHTSFHPPQTNSHWQNSSGSTNLVCCFILLQ